MNDVEEMRRLKDQGISYRGIAKLVGVSASSVYVALTGFDWALQQRLRPFVIERDGQSCTGCGGDKHLGIHHNDGDVRNNSLTNLLTLCRSCHASLHGSGHANPVKACLICGQPVAHIKRTYCSHRCTRVAQSDGRGLTIAVCCTHCGSLFTMKAGRLIRRNAMSKGGLFCSKRCSGLHSIPQRTRSIQGALR